MTHRYLTSVIAVFALIISIAACKSAAPTVEVKETIEVDDRYAFQFVKSDRLVPVLDQAEQEGKLIFLDVYASWCLPCKMMDEDVFSHEPTANMINDRFISYKVDAERSNGPDIAVIYEVKSYPTLLFLDHKGRVLERKEGAAYHRELLELADRAWAKYPNKDLGLGSK